MGPKAAAQFADLRCDGFGVRRIEKDPHAGRVDVLDVRPILATPAAEQSIRTRAARFADANVPVLAPVIRIGRAGEGLSVTTMAPEGITLADLLGALEFESVALSDAALLELAGVTIRAVAALHEIPGTMAHGALCAAHVLLCRDGAVMLTGAVYGEALQGLQYNRARLWREFGLALPPSASLPRFDRRADLTQLGALVLAILMRRTLAGAEYPRGIGDLVATATANIAASKACTSALRMWLQQALLLHPKARFSSAVDGSRAYDDLIAGVSGRRDGAQALLDAIGHLSGGHVPRRDAPGIAAPPLAPAPIGVPPAGPDERPRVASRGFAFLRSVLGAS